MSLIFFPLFFRDFFRVLGSGDTVVEMLAESFDKCDCSSNDINESSLGFEVREPEGLVDSAIFCQVVIRWEIVVPRVSKPRVGSTNEGIFLVVSGTTKHIPETTATTAMTM